MAIEIRTRTGDRLDLGTAAVHTAVYMFLMATVIGWAVSALCIMATRYHQGLPDLLLGTAAINRPLD